MRPGAGSRTGDETSSIEPGEDTGTAFALLVSAASGVEVVAIGDRAEIVIGRADGCDVVVADASLSRRHARLCLRERITLEDLDSKNGTSLHGRRLAPGESAAVGVGTAFELGTATFVLERARGLDAGSVAPSRRAGSGGRSPVVRDRAMANLYALVDVFAPSTLALLVLGETGVGKEVYAEEVHRRSLRARGPFVAINCAAIPETMFEAEVFGYEKGAFTGAMRAKPGLFEAADGGTVFLDEVGEIPLPMQAKLLRALETGRITRLGSLKPRTVDVRVVSATNRDLRLLVGEQRFRPDLYFRINGMSVTLPPLRARRDDIVPLAEYFVARAAAAAKRPPPPVTAAAVARLKAHPWPGNVRELRNVVDRAVLLSRWRVIDDEHLVLDAMEAPATADRIASAPPSSGRSASNEVDVLKGRLREIERTRVADALARTGGNESHAAKLLGISRFTLMKRMQEFRMTRPRKRRATDE
jgi:DNA-binding NtrC family response regulator